MINRIGILENSSALNSLPVTNSGSQLYHKIGGDVKMRIKEKLMNIKNSISPRLATPVR
jgi:hypothetical protein